MDAIAGIIFGIFLLLFLASLRIETRTAEEEWEEYKTIKWRN